jgi:CheY-like chemotaxis protein
MNDNQVPNPDLENVAKDPNNQQPSASAISHGVNPASSQQPLEPPVQLTQTGQVAQPITPTSQPKTVFIIEDERFISELYTRALEKAGYKVTSASDGEKALHIAQQNTFDLILLDIMLPTINGVDILYQLKNPDNAVQLTAKVIITTNMDQKEETKAKVESMADGYLIKAEVTPKELVQYVNQVFGL